MIYKKISYTLSLFILMIKAFSVPVGDNLLSDSDDEFTDLVDNFDLTEDIKEVDMFSDDDSIITDIINPEDNTECLTEECFSTSKRILSNMDMSVNPCEDFYQYSCGGWINQHIEEFSDERLIIYNSIENELKTNFLESFKKLMNDEIPFTDKEPEYQEYSKKIVKIIKNIFNFCMNDDDNGDNGDKYDKYNDKYLIDFLNKLDIYEEMKELNDTDKLTNLIIKLQLNGLDTIISINTKIFINESINLSRYSKYINQAKQHPDLLLIFKEYISKVLSIFYDDQKVIEEKSELISNFTQILTDNNLNMNGDFFEMRDDSKRISVKELNEKYPFINWKLYFEKLFEFYSVNKVKLDNFEVKIHDVKLLEKINNIILESDIKTVTTYLEWYVINELFYNSIFNNLIDEYYQSSEDIIFNNDNNLPTYYYENDDAQTDFYDFENELPSDHEFYPEDTSDEDDPNSKIEHCARVISGTMPDAITKFIADNVYSINVKNIEKDLKQMFNNIKEAMVKRISNLEWLEEETKKKGLEKLEKKKLNIGINDVLNLKELYQKYQYLENRNIDDFTLNLDANIAETGIHLKNLVLNGSFDDDVMINAFNDEETNTIHISYPIVHSPFYIDNEKDYLNYGAIGMVIAHELIHSYDNNNRYIFANEGNISWLTEDDNKDYDELIQCFIDQYNHFLVKDGKYIDGEETLAENIADNGSISKAYDAWKLSLLKDPENASKHNRLLPGFSDYTLDQLFYISFAQTQCKIENDYFLTDTHSTGKARINVVLQNSEHFAKTFNCPLNSSMNPESKCVIW